MAQLLGSARSRLIASAPFPKERGVKRVDEQEGVAASSLSFRRGCAGWMPRADGPTKPSTTVAAAGETRVFLS